jgi:hypothetical protein
MRSAEHYRDGERSQEFSNHALRHHQLPPHVECRAPVHRDGSTGRAIPSLASNRSRQGRIMPKLTCKRVYQVLSGQAPQNDSCSSLLPMSEIAALLGARTTLWLRTVEPFWRGACRAPARSRRTVECGFPSIKSVSTRARIPALQQGRKMPPGPERVNVPTAIGVCYPVGGVAGRHRASQLMKWDFNPLRPSRRCHPDDSAAGASCHHDVVHS